LLKKAKSQDDEELDDEDEGAYPGDYDGPSRSADIAQQELQPGGVWELDGKACGGKAEEGEDWGPPWAGRCGRLLVFLVTFQAVLGEEDLFSCVQRQRMI